MTRRHLTSRKVVLTAAFLALASGGTAACDAGGPDDGGDGLVTGAGETVDPDDAAPTTRPARPATTRSATTRPTTVAPAPVVDRVTVDPDDGEVFYCADVDGEIVDEYHCDDDPEGGTYLLWHSSGYARGLPPGSFLEGGEQFASGDAEARRAFRLPTTGTIANGTIKTNVVGRGSVTSGSDTSAGG